MTTRVRILWLLVLGALLGGGNVCAQDGLGQIIYNDQDAAVTTAGGLLEFFNNDACDFDSEGNYHLPAYENVPPEWLDAERTVYIKATPNPGHKLGAADATTGAVTFITATETVAMSGGNNARTRADGDAITVTLTRDGEEHRMVRPLGVELESRFFPMTACSVMRGILKDLRNGAVE